MSEQPERCDCPWPDSPVPEEPCGCGEHDARLYRDDVWHYAGKHWVAACLIKHLAAVPPVATDGWQDMMAAVVPVQDVPQCAIHWRPTTAADTIVRCALPVVPFHETHRSAEGYQMRSTTAAMELSAPPADAPQEKV